MTLPYERYRPLIDDWAAFQAAVVRPLPTVIWANPLKTNADNLQNLMAQRGIPLQPLPWYPGAFYLPNGIQPGLQWEYMAGLFHVQEEVSLLPALFMDVQPTDRVLDMCAAPGSKTAQIGVMMGNRGTLVANDRNVGRMRAVRQVLNRIGLYNVTITTADAGNLPRGMGLFDKVLADVPCTCEGTCRKSPEVMRRVDGDDWQRLARTQTAVLRKAVQMCKVGGRIVYSTCTFAPEENERVVHTILQEFGDAVLRLLPASVPQFHTSPGVTEWQGEAFHPDLRHALRVWPHQNDSGGFFVAVLQKLQADRDPAFLAQPQLVTDQFAVQLQPEPWLSVAAERFGWSPEQLSEVVLLRMGQRGAWMVNRDHLPPATPADSLGMMYMRTSERYPKLSTAVAQLLGNQATQNFILLTSTQVQAFFARQDFPLSDDQTTHCTGTGYVLLLYQQHPVGVGIYYAHTKQIESTFPKGWTRPNIAA